MGINIGTWIIIVKHLCIYVREDFCLNSSNCYGSIFVSLQSIYNYVWNYVFPNFPILVIFLVPAGKIFYCNFFSNLQVSGLQASPFVKYFNFKVSKQNFSKISYYNKFGAYDDIFAEFSGIFENSILDS